MKTKNNMIEETSGDKYSALEERTFKYAQGVFKLVRLAIANVINKKVGDQLVRASGSVGANYIEANNSLGRKDCLMKMKICKKEALESVYWLRLLDIDESKGELEKLRNLQIEEGRQSISIFWAIIGKLR